MVNNLRDIIRKIPHFKGKFRVIKYLFSDYLKQAKDIIIEGKYGLKYKLPNLYEVIGFEIFADGIYEKSASDFIISRLPSNGIFIDIGANIGSIVLPVCIARDDIKAFCVEGSIRVFNYLKFNVSVNNIQNCKIFNKVISEKDIGFINFYSPKDLYGKGSMNPIFTHESESVESITLDKMTIEEGIEIVDFIKIDIEGFEYHAFKGGEKLLSLVAAPDILFEFLDWAEALVNDLNPGDAQKLLLSYGYSIFKVTDRGGLIRLNEALLIGSEMLFASKRFIS
ncbi:MAG: FkbM family methyltransferase [Saprospiraceae bacterium]|nr:FkbM family methyltransferase [Saprospiraceae bacterium]